MITYFDLTDVIRYAESNSRVTGIQRVQLRIISELIELYPSRVSAVYFDKTSRAHLTFDCRAALGPAGTEFCPNDMLRALGVRKPSLLPDKYQIKQHLKPYDHNKPFRAVMKVYLYALGLLAPGRLLARGFEPWRGQGTTPVSVRTAPLQLHAVDTLALLGSFWDFDEVIALARKHRDRGGRVAVLVHDVIPVAAPQYCSPGQIQQFWARFRHVHEYANKFLAISQHTANDFKACMKGQCHDLAVEVVPLAHQFGFQKRLKHKTPQAETVRPYLLCIGTIESRKNGLTLLKAWEKVADHFGSATPDLVFCGKYGLGSDVFKKYLASNPKIKNHVRIETSPSDEDLALLIQRSLFTVFPSFYEGWGLPVGEAAWLGKFCLASSASSVPEVLGDLAEYVDPHDEAAWAARLIELIQDPAILAEKERHIQDAELRSWQDVAKSMLREINS